MCGKGREERVCRGERGEGGEGGKGWKGGDRRCVMEDISECVWEGEEREGKE